MFSTWYGKSKDLVKRTQSDKVLRDKAFKIASDPKYDGYQRGLASMVYKFFDKKWWKWCCYWAKLPTRKWTDY